MLNTVEVSRRWLLTSRFAHSRSIINNLRTSQHAAKQKLQNIPVEGKQSVEVLASEYSPRQQRRRPFQLECSNAFDERQLGVDYVVLEALQPILILPQTHKRSAPSPLCSSYDSTRIAAATNPARLGETALKAALSDRTQSHHTTRRGGCRSLLRELCLTAPSETRWRI